MTGISTDRKQIETATFDESTVDECLAWIEARNGELNNYFHVNPTIEWMTKKASREDVKSLDWLHVDIDPRAGEDMRRR